MVFNMKKVLALKFLLLPLLILAGAAASVPAQQQQQKTEWSRINKIYIGDLGRQENADLVREKIRVRLMKSNRFTVVDSADEADAVLTGVAGVSESVAGTVQTNPATGQISGSAGTVYQGAGVLRLIDAKAKRTIWIYEYKPGFARPGSSVSSRVAEKTVKQLLKDARQ